ncbi:MULTISPECIES: nicotianamine synthase family protein [Bacillus]|uniref:nicotianamine synthase family protein n=1 Tax=Bacillus TaxID=1386 RepID=UPI0003F7CCF9|nr:MULTISPECIES: nicotianamine synthase family protein [Bacillus]QHZ46897.1 methyltransferase domain-containing protein [Bacillus sp. NSP9.1]
MQALKTFQECLLEFSEKFDDLAEKYDQTTSHCSELEVLIDDYCAFITNERNKAAWEQLDFQISKDLQQLVKNLRKKSAQCVAIMEKYRALKLLKGDTEIADYFQNIESCIEKEFGSFQITAESKVLLVGSGSFPMTLLLISKRTGAEVVGIDIDEEAIELGRNVVKTLGDELNIHLDHVPVQELSLIKDVTHIIFSSTVESKYDILEQLYDITNEHVVVAMRYGNGLKSLFNYPIKEVDRQKWKMMDQVLRAGHIFDIALYQKA